MLYFEIYFSRWMEKIYPCFISIISYKILVCLFGSLFLVGAFAFAFRVLGFFFCWLWSINFKLFLVLRFSRDVAISLVFSYSFDSDKKLWDLKGRSLILSFLWFYSFISLKYLLYEFVCSMFLHVSISNLNIWFRIWASQVLILIYTVFIYNI